MLTELTGIVEACLGIPVTITPAALVVWDWPCNVLLAEHLLAVNDCCHISYTCTEAVLTVLLGGVVGIIRTFNLEVQTRSNETHIKFVLQVEVQHIGTLVNVTQVVIV